MKNWLKDWRPCWEDVLFVVLLMVAVAVLTLAALQFRHLLARNELFGLTTHKVVTIPLTEINACHDRKGVIRVKDGKWACEAEK